MDRRSWLAVVGLAALALTLTVVSGTSDTQQTVKAVLDFLSGESDKLFGAMVLIAFLGFLGNMR